MRRYVLLALVFVSCPSASQAEISLENDLRRGACVETTDAGSPVKLCRTENGTLRVEPISENDRDDKDATPKRTKTSGSVQRPHSSKGLSTGVRVFIGALLLDVLLVRHPFMMWYRKRRWVVRGRDSVDVLYGHLGSRLKFELLILWASVFVFFVLLGTLDAAGVLSMQDLLQLPPSPHGSP